MSLELPLGFGMALAQNEAAMKRFESLSEPEKQAVLARTHSVTSKRQMQQLVDSLWVKSRVGPVDKCKKLPNPAVVPAE